MGAGLARIGGGFNKLIFDASPKMSRTRSMKESRHLSFELLGRNTSVLTADVSAYQEIRRQKFIFHCDLHRRAKGRAIPGGYKLVL
jgi:hypothetical protein